jgi:arsenate reductase (thioredoxin)
MNTIAANQGGDLSVDQRLALRTAAVRLADEFAGVFGVETVERFLWTG